MHRAGLVYAIDHRCDRCRLAAAGGPGDEDQPVLEGRPRLRSGGQPDVGHRRNPILESTNRKRVVAAFAKQAHTKSLSVFTLHAEVDVTARFVRLHLFIGEEILKPIPQ